MLVGVGRVGYADGDTWSMTHNFYAVTTRGTVQDAGRTPSKLNVATVLTKLRPNLSAWKGCAMIFPLNLFLYPPTTFLGLLFISYNCFKTHIHQFSA